MKKALVFESESRVHQVHDEGFPVAAPFRWVTCPDEVTAEDYLFENGGFALKPASVETQSQVISRYEAALDRHLDSVAKAHRFNDRHSLALRAGYPSPYQPLGTAFATWMDGCNYQAYQRLQRVIAGTEPMPTIEAFINDLPAFVFGG